MSSNVQDFWEELECPICNEYMRPPIRMCKIGHSICHICHAKTKKCPQCQAEFTDTRNFALEKLFEKVPIPCKNSFYGCTFKSKGDKLVEHEYKCSFVLRKCPLTLVNRCTFRARIVNLKEHIHDKHSDFIKDLDDNCSKIFFEHKIDKNTSTICKKLYLVDMNYNIFAILIKEEKKFIKWNVFLIGSPNAADRFDYELSLKHCDAGRRGILLGKICDAAYDGSVEFDEDNTAFLISRESVEDCLNESGTLFFSFELKD